MAPGRSYRKTYTAKNHVKLATVYMHAGRKKRTGCELATRSFVFIYPRPSHCDTQATIHFNMARMKVTEAHPTSPRRGRRCFVLYPSNKSASRQMMSKRQPVARVHRLAGTGVTYLTSVASYHAQVNVKGYKQYAGKIALGRYAAPELAQYAVQLARTWLVANGYSTRLDPVHIHDASRQPCARMRAHISASVAGRVRRWLARTHPEAVHAMASGLLHM